MTGQTHSISDTRRALNNGKNKCVCPVFGEIYHLKTG
jgi:hypothetical protein